MSKRKEGQGFEDLGRGMDRAGKVGAPMVDRIFRPWLTKEGADHRNWASDADWTQIQEKPLRARALLYGILVTLALLVYWASVAEIDEVARGDGRVIPSQNLQVLQSMDGGVVSDILVREGDVVERGDVMVRIDPTRFLSDLGEARASEFSLRARQARLIALLSDTPFLVTPELQQGPPAIVEQEQQLYEESLAELNSRIRIAEEQMRQRQEELNEVRARRTQAVRALELASRELDVTEPLVQSGAVSEVEVLRLQREVSNARGDRDQATAQIARLNAAIEEAEEKIREVRLNFRNQWRAELADTLGRLQELAEGTEGLEDRVRLSEVRSPMTGIVQRMFVTTRGGVISPGREVAEVVPLEDELLIEARVSPQDIAYLRPGLQARVKFTAYDFAIYGGLEATVEHISPDTITDDDGNTFYKVRVRTEETGFDEEHQIMTGMVAQVDIITGRRTILQYLLKPILRAGDLAFTER
ncbi:MULTISPECIES: HlyD family type I secretion periplasmic adaptor subunit [unclassified Thioalkalivibrio]|uniref:HlyD family type I secretion periplasmic adaptor subunit n=1 Tax=unclassified Thioalkalivibrio TaxID=2621013 RepID=UPI0003784E67|nr:MULTISPECIES: HlyD family type I secretion periplasmic adaptor subunit [unclassified Thioalkalivibrio]